MLGRVYTVSVKIIGNRIKGTKHKVPKGHCVKTGMQAV